MAFIKPKNREANKPPNGGLMFILFADDSPESQRRLSQIHQVAFALGKDPADIVQDLVEASLDALSSDND